MLYEQSVRPGVDGTGSESCLVAGFAVSGVQLSQKTVLVSCSYLILVSVILPFVLSSRYTRSVCPVVLLVKLT
jgi:hypothetical protein